MTILECGIRKDNYWHLLSKEKGGALWISFGLAAVTEDGHKWFYIDYKGNKVCGDYAAVGNFRSDGMAFVKFDGSSNIGYFINPQGEIILICEEHEHKIYNLRRYNGNQK